MSIFLFTFWPDHENDFLQPPNFSSHILCTYTHKVTIYIPVKNIQCENIPYLTELVLRGADVSHVFDVSSQVFGLLVGEHADKCLVVVYFLQQTRHKLLSLFFLSLHLSDIVINRCKLRNILLQSSRLFIGDKLIALHLHLTSMTQWRICHE